MSKLRREKFLNKWVAQCSYNNDCHDCKDAPECGLAYLQIMETIQKPDSKSIVEKLVALLRERYGFPAYKEKHHNTATDILELFSLKNRGK